MPTPPLPTVSRTPIAAALLSFVWPGLGQWYVGRRRRAAIFAIPVVVVLLLVASQLVGGLDIAAVTMLDPTFALLVLVAVVVIAVWRIVSVVDAFARAGGPALRPRPPRAIVLLLVAIVGMHALTGYYVWAFYDAGSRIFNQTGDMAPGPTPSPGGPSVTDLPDASDYLAPPAATPATAESRVNILLTGVDSGHDRNHALTDTLLVVSIDPATKQVVMLSIPRDVSSFPLYFGGTYAGKINALMTSARLYPALYPDGPINTLAKEVGFLLGIPIHYTAAINLEGFQKMVDLVGGVDIVNPRQIADPSYDWFNGTYGFYLSAGPHHLDGQHALAYVRSRMGAGDNDFTRAARQQQLLVALRGKMASPSILANLPAILNAAASTITTNFPPDRVKQFIELGKQIDDSSIQRFVLGPPYSFHPPSNTTGGIYTLTIDLTKVGALSVQLFGSDSAYAPPPSAIPSAQP